MKRIAVISYHQCPLSDETNAEVGGMGIYVLELSRELAKKGFKIDIFTRSSEQNTPKIVKVSQNLRVIHLSDSKTNIHKKKLREYIPEFLKSFYEFVNEEELKYDLISAHYYLSGLVGLEIKRKYNIPLFVTFHTLSLMKNLVAKDAEEKEDIERIKAEVMLAKKADKIIATSDTDKEYIHTLYNCSSEKIEVLIPGIDLNLFRPFDKLRAKKNIKADEDHKIILFVGRIVPLKGLDVLFYAIKILLEKNPKVNFCLWIVGENKIKFSKELKRLEELKKLLGIHTYVRFLPMKKQNELPAYYNASELVIMPSNYESFGIIALEAMACGVPVITTDVTGIADLFDKKHESLITSASNPIMLSRKINNLLTNKEEYQKVSREVYEKVQDLGWERVAEKFIDILNNFL